MFLPSDKTLVIDEGKVSNYLLNKNSVAGKAKAEFFLKNGIALHEPNVLEQLLL